MTPDALVTKIEIATDRLNAGLITLIVGACPLCGKTHRYGGGTDLARVTECLGHRVAHCRRGDGYMLVLADHLTYPERIKRRLPAGYDRLFGRDDDATDNELRPPGRPPVDRPGPADPENEDDPVSRIE